MSQVASEKLEENATEGVSTGFVCRIVTPASVVTEMSVTKVLVKGLGGRLAIYKGHAPLVTVTQKGLMYLFIPGEKEPEIFNVEEGVAEVTSASVTLFTADASPNEDDVVRDTESIYIWDA